MMNGSVCRREKVEKKLFSPLFFSALENLLKKRAQTLVAPPILTEDVPLIPTNDQLGTPTGLCEYLLMRKVIQSLVAPPIFTFI